MTSSQRWKGIMKAVPFEEKRLAKWRPPYLVQPKLDGFRCRAVPVDGKYILLSSEENVVFSVPHIVESLNNSRLNIELDGELYTHGMSFNWIESVASRTANLHSDYKDLQFHVFDIINDKYQIDRTLELTKISNSYPYINFVKSSICNNLSDIMKIYDIYLEEKYEGIIVRHLNCPYERKRSTWMMKFKPKKEDIYIIKGYKEEISIDGIPKNRLGSLIVSSQDGDVFSVGTGFKDEERENLWKARDLLLGRQVVVQYQHLTSGRKVPRFPVFYVLL